MDENKNTYRISYDEALLAYSVLQRLEAGNVTTFSERLKSQKIQYLAQVFGISPVYKFSLYIRGPYSPDLAADLFQFASTKIDISKFIPSELEDRFSKLKGFIADKDVRKLELVATLHWLLKVACFPKSEAMATLVDWKKANKNEVEYTLTEIEKI